MKKRFFQILLILALCGLLPTTTHATEGHANHYNCGTVNCTDTNHDHTTIDAWTAWDGTTILADGVSYYLAGDVVVSETVQIAANTTVNLCLNGYKLELQLAEGEFGSVIEIDNGATLNLCDCYNGESKYTVDDPAKDDNSTIAIPGGVLTGGNERDATYGGGVDTSGTFTMYSGSIAGNSGNGVYNIDYGDDSRGKFTMYGGLITGNRAFSGGGVDNNGTFTMLGGTISGNYATDWNSSSGVINTGEMTMSNNAEVSGNYGGGVHNLDGVLVLSGNAKISDNHGTGIDNDFRGSAVITIADSVKISGNRGSGVYNDGGIVTMTGGSISQNVAFTGGGVNNEDGVFTMKGGSISENIADYGGGVYNGIGTLYLSGGSITGNSAYREGGGVCYGHDEIYLSGSIVITDNTANGNASNLSTGSFTVNGALDAEARIGVSLNSNITYIGRGGHVFIRPDGTNVSSLAEYAGCFFSDNDDRYYLKEEDGVLKLHEISAAFVYGYLKVTITEPELLNQVVIFAAGYEDGRMVESHMAYDLTQFPMNERDSIRVFILDRNTFVPLFREIAL